MTDVIKNEYEVLPGHRVGVLVISKDTLGEVKQIMAQSMPTDDALIDELFQDMAKDGYKVGFPVVLAKHGPTYTSVDGFTRLTAACHVVEQGLATVIEIPFHTSIESGRAYNSSTRGTSAKELAYLFQRNRGGGVKYGTSDRAAKQSLFASQLLDVAKHGETKAFEPNRTQAHTSKVVRNKTSFVNAYVECCHILSEIGEDPENVKLSHWLAFFVRYGVNRATSTIAAQHIIRNGDRSKRTDILATFNVMSVKAASFNGGL